MAASPAPRAPSPTQSPKFPPPPAAPSGAKPARELDLPMPDSIEQIVKSPRKFIESNSDMLAVYRGYYEAAPGKLRRIQVNNTGGRTVKIELADGKEREWQGALADFEMFNFNGDPYSLILDMTGAKRLYLKFHTGRPVPGYDEPNFRTMVGYLIENNSAKPVAMIDGLMMELQNIKVKGEYIWPSAGTCRQLMPPPIN
jgi:hypothetical protein